MPDLIGHLKEEMKHLKTHIFVTLLTLLAAGQAAWAYEDSFSLNCTVNGNNAVFVVKCNSTTIFSAQKTINADSQFKWEFNQYKLYSSPYSVVLNGTLCYNNDDEYDTVVNEGDFTITVTSSTMRINYVYFYTSLTYQYPPDNHNEVTFIAPKERKVHLSGFTVDYTPFVTFADFTRLDENIYEIATKDDLLKLAHMVNDGFNDCDGVTFRQTAPISFDYDAYERIGCNYDYSFRGTYDGQGFSISKINLSINQGNYLGIFGYILNGTVQNVVLVDSQFLGHYYVGGIAGFNNGGTVRNCIVTNVTIDSITDSKAHGGIVGSNLSGSVIGCFSSAIITCHNGKTSEYGGIVGNNYGIIRDCFFDGPSIVAKSELGSVAGVNNEEGELINNYHRDTNIGGVNGSDVDGARRARTVTLGDNVALAGSEIAYVITNHSSRTAIGTTALRYNDGTSMTIYSGEGQTLTLDYTGSVPAGSVPAFKVNNAYIVGNSFTMPAGPVTVTAGLVQTSPISVTGRLSDGVYWSTFCHEVLRYALPEGATAYTMDAEHHLYRLGDNGQVIPAGVAVVIIADRASITLTLNTDGSTITDHAPDPAHNALTGGNILHGSNDPVAVSSLPAGKSAYVLSVDDSGAIGFRQYTGTDAIPANKAYYVQ